MPEEEEYFDETDWLTPLGFKPGRVVVFNDPTTFELGDLLDSLTKSTQTNPKTVALPVGISMTASVVIDTVHSKWAEHEHADAPAGEVVYHDTPDWYMEGQVQESTTRVRLFVIACGGSHIDSVWLQFITDEETADGIIRVVCIDSA